MLLGAHAIDVCCDLRHVDGVAREDSRELRRLIDLRQRSLQCSVQLVITQIGAILELQREPAQGAEAGHRWRRKHADVRVLDAGELLAESLRDARAAQSLALALIERLQRKEHDPGVGAVGESLDGQTREGNRALDSGILQPDVGHAPDHILGAIERSGIGKLCERDQVQLVLRRDEARWHDPEHEPGHAEESCIHNGNRTLTANDAGDAFAITLRGTMKEAIEGPEHPAEQPIDDACGDVGLGVTGLEEYRAERRAQGERVECRDNG